VEYGGISMSIWGQITGVIKLEIGVTEDQLLSIYGLFSHNLKGSEGGLNISFTRTERKDGRSSAESEYNVERYTRVDNMVIQGSLRDFDESNIRAAYESLREYLYYLRDRKMINSASFILYCSLSDFHYTISYLKERVRSKKCY